MSTARMYFIAIVAPNDIHEQVLQWKHYMRDHYGCAVALRSPAHITLVPPFWMQEEVEQDLIKDLLSFAGEREPFQIELHNFDAFKPRVIFVRILENEPLQQLKSHLEERLVASNKYPIKKEIRPFHPHLTIAARDLRKKDFAPAFEHFSKIQYRQQFTASHLALMKHNGNQWVVSSSLPLASVL